MLFEISDTEKKPKVPAVPAEVTMINNLFDMASQRVIETEEVV